MADSITENDIKKFIVKRPHVFILGAGASKAALPNGDRNGVECPVMEGFLKETGLEHIIQGTPFQSLNDNLETIYSAIHESGKFPKKLKALEKGVRDCFEQLAIPFTPTIYDYLLLSLRDKDYIFTFNWDDLLIQAFFRVRNITSNLPKIYFLHGNIAIGYCESCPGVVHISDKVCPKCGKNLIPQPLLYPVREKNYQFNKSISDAWNDFLTILKDCSILTIFGYGAPPSDAAAIDLMKTAFSATFRRFDSIEIIDVKPESQLLDEWEPFIAPTNYHVKCYNSLFDSFISKFPRRSIEGYYQKYFNGWWGKSSIELEQKNSIWEIGDLIQPLLDRELNNDYSVI